MDFSNHMNRGRSVVGTLAGLVMVEVLHPRFDANRARRFTTPAHIVASWVTLMTFVGARTDQGTPALPKPQLKPTPLMTMNKELFSTPYTLPSHKTQMSTRQEVFAQYRHPTIVVPDKLFLLTTTYMIISVTAGCVSHRSLNPTSLYMSRCLQRTSQTSDISCHWLLNQLHSLQWLIQGVKVAWPVSRS